MTDRDGRPGRQEVEKLRKQRATLARFGRHALRTHDLDALLREATEIVSEAIEVEFVKVLELLPDGETMLVRAGVNWKPGVVGHATFGAHERSPAGYALLTCEPVISNDLATEDRFDIPDLLKDHGIKSMVNVVICGERAAWGVLEVDAPRHRDFDQDDIDFLHTYANLLASAIERLDNYRELAEAAETRGMLLGELQHRVRNLLANIRALAKRTCASSANLDEFAVAFDKRLSALARTQNLLTRDPKELVGIRDIVLQEQEAHGVQIGERLTLNGPDEPLSRKAVQALALGIHELATNAVKHGALAADRGRIDVSWTIQPSSDGKEMLVRWREHGVEIKDEPSRRGLGSQLIEKSVPYMLGGTSTLAFHSDGLECTIRFPLTEKPHSPSGAPSAGK